MEISVIVPVYNSEKYISRCIKSVLKQTYRDWQLILVDDGSIDDSLSVLKKYENLDSRIVVIHQDNAGPGMARNAGIANATGEYIVFLDSDDEITKDYLERLAQHDEDVVFIDIDQVGINGRVLRREYMSRYIHLTKNEFLRQQMTGMINWGGVRKAVKSALLKANNIRFSEHKIGEEAVYSFMVLYHAKSYSFIKGCVYKYVNRPNSQSSLMIEDPWGPVAERLKDVCKEISVYDNYADTINSFFYTALIVSLDKMASIYSMKQFKKKAYDRLKTYEEQYNNSFGLDTQNLSVKAKCVKFIVKRKWFGIFYVISLIKQKILG